MVGLTLSFSTCTLSSLPFSTLVDSALSLMALSLSLTGVPFADSDSVGTSFSSVVCRSASSVWWTGSSMTSLLISKETFYSTIF